MKPSVEGSIGRRFGHVFPEELGKPAAQGKTGLSRLLQNFLFCSSLSRLLCGYFLLKYDGAGLLQH